MKKVFTMLLTTLLFCSCESLFQDIDYLFLDKVVLKGKISNNKSSSPLQKAPSDNEFTLADAAKVMVFYGNQYQIIEIKSDGSFSGKVPLGNSTLVTFLTEDNQFIGNLYTGGLNFLPLQGLEEKIDLIDFSTLTLDNKRVIPENDPVGKSIKLTEAELSFMKEVGKFYESMAKNIDMNNNKIPDLYEDITIFLSTSRQFDGGECGIKGEKEAKITGKYDLKGTNILKIEGYVDWFSEKIIGISKNATLTGPAANPYNDIINNSNQEFDDNERDKEWYGVDFARQNNDLFETGTYTLHIDNQDFSFDYYFDLNMKDFWVFAVPTLVVDSKGYVTEVEIEYQLKDGRKVKPERVLSSSISLTINVFSYDSSMDVYDSWSMSGNGKPGEGAIVEIVRRNALENLRKNYNHYKIELPKPIKLSNIESVGTSYLDMFNNSAGNSWTP
ncbi:MAG: hypothetical protein JXR27_05780 [Paludibacteraceae bacterium]|nr:hypothetical protein [Paludibacteraceae bacterium]